MAILGGAALRTASGVVIPKPALAWWRGGVWIAGPGYYPNYYRPRPYYYAPPIVVAPPPVYYAPPPVYYPQAPGYPSAAYPPVAYASPARTCYAQSFSCPMEVPRTPGAACYCSDQAGGRSYGTAH